MPSLRSTISASGETISAETVSFSSPNSLAIVALRFVKHPGVTGHCTIHAVEEPLPCAPNMESYASIVRTSASLDPRNLAAYYGLRVHKLIFSLQPISADL